MKGRALALLLRRADWITFGAMLALVGLGLLFIFSSTHQAGGSALQGLVRRQLVFAGVGMAVYAGVAMADYHRFGTWSGALYAAALAALALVFAVGTRRFGALRWIEVGPVTVQPSEAVKLGLVLVVSRILARPARLLREVRWTAFALALTALPFWLIFRQPDLGTAAVLLPVTLGLLYAAGVPLRVLVALGVIGLLLLPLGWFVLGDYQRQRLLVYFQPDIDPLGAGWNKRQSEIAVGAGGLWGKGVLRGTQNLLGFLPSTVAPTDFIFSVLAEEVGFVGCALVLVLYAIVLLGVFRAALQAPDKLGRLFCVGVGILLFFHAFVNMGMTVGLMPVTGLPLPLLSYGGSFLVSTLAGLGLVQSVYLRRRPRE